MCDWRSVLSALVAWAGAKGYSMLKVTKSQRKPGIQARLETSSQCDARDPVNILSSESDWFLMRKAPFRNHGRSECAVETLSVE